MPQDEPTVARAGLYLKTRVDTAHRALGTAAIGDCATHFDPIDLNAKACYCPAHGQWIRTGGTVTANAERAA